MHWIALRPQPEKIQAHESVALEAGLPDTLAALGWWALQFTPKVVWQGAALLLEVSASERLWGGARQLCQKIAASNKPVAIAQYAHGASSLIALARLHDTRLAHLQPDALPLSALAAAEPHLPILKRIGCTCWGQLRALPRAGVARRFGAPLLAALDRAYGLQPEIYRWLELPDFFEATLELGAQVDAAPALLFGARRLFKQLQRWLQLRHVGVLALALGWTMEPRRGAATQDELVLRSAEPTQNTVHLLRLLGEQLARVSLNAPVLYLHLHTLETQKNAGESASLPSDEQRTGDSLQQLLERLSARLGPQNVLQMQAHADHRPERMQRWSPASNATQLLTPEAYRTDASSLCQHQAMEWLYPTWLLSKPLKLAVHCNHPQYSGPLTLLAGPQRLEAAWWDSGNSVLRDYFLARNEQAHLLWVYRERLSRSGQTEERVKTRAEAGPQWYLHGLFA